MSADVGIRPHPLLTCPILYIADAPIEIDFKQFADVFKPCGVILNGDRGQTKAGRQKWTIVFQDVFDGEWNMPRVSI